jgi:hypothetical protein
MGHPPTKSFSGIRLHSAGQSWQGSHVQNKFTQKGLICLVERHLPDCNISGWRLMIIEINGISKT